MTDTQVECFVEAAKEKNISKAAETLFLTQQAASSQIKALEKELGFKLFHRGTKGITLTKEGELLFDEWEELVNRFRISIDKVKDFHLRKNGHIRIALEDMGNCNEEIMVAFSEYEEKYNGLHIDFETMTPKLILKHFEADNLDMAISYQSEFDGLASLKCIPLHRKKLKIRIYLSKNHPLAAKEDLSLADLGNETIGLLHPSCSFDFKKSVTAFFHYHGLKLPENCREYASRRDLELSLIAGQCVTIVYETMFLDEERKLLSKEIDASKYSSRIALFWKDDDMDTKVHALADILKIKLKRFD